MNLAKQIQTLFPLFSETTSNNSSSLRSMRISKEQEMCRNSHDSTSKSTFLAIPLFNGPLTGLLPFFPRYQGLAIKASGPGELVFGSSTLHK